jgi:putative FmdB family regulatory protein
LYAYRCTQCGHRFEKIQNFSAEPELICPVCQGVLERPLTVPRLHFKGAGWYVNDYAAKSSAPSGESASSETKDSASKSDAKGDAAPSAPATPAATPSPSPAASAATPASSATASHS